MPAQVTRLAWSVAYNDNILWEGIIYTVIAYPVIDDTHVTLKVGYPRPIDSKEQPLTEIRVPMQQQVTLIR